MADNRVFGRGIEFNLKLRFYKRFAGSGDKHNIAYAKHLYFQLIFRLGFQLLLFSVVYSLLSVPIKLVAHSDDINTFRTKQR